jgi:hypothetical protein
VTGDIDTKYERLGPGSEKEDEAVRDFHTVWIHLGSLCLCSSSEPVLVIRGSASGCPLLQVLQVPKAQRRVWDRLRHYLP